MAAELNIRYKIGADVFSVLLGAESSAVFRQAEQQPGVSGKEGEDFIAALLAHAPGSISWVMRHKNGLVNNGPNGEPARLMFGKNGDITLKEYGLNGDYNDSANGEPAVQIFDDRGWLTRAENYKDGKKIKTWSEQEIKDYMHQQAVKNAGRAPSTDAKKPNAASAPKIR